MQYNALQTHYFQRVYLSHGATDPYFRGPGHAQDVAVSHPYYILMAFCPVLSQNHAIPWRIV